MSRRTVPSTRRAAGRFVFIARVLLALLAVVLLSPAGVALGQEDCLNLDATGEPPQWVFDVEALRTSAEEGDPEAQLTLWIAISRHRHDQRCEGGDAVVPSRD